jgi:hypothetical protein
MTKQSTWFNNQRSTIKVVYNFFIAATMLMLTAFLGVPSAGAEPSCPDRDRSSPTLILDRWWDSSRGDMVTTTHPVWEGCWGATRTPSYEYFGFEGRVFNPAHSQPPGTVPLSSWYDPNRLDNATTTHPAWQPVSTSDIHRTPNYTYYRLEGYVYDPNFPQPPNTVPIYSYWSSELQDNVLTTSPLTSGTWVKYRLEGYVLEVAQPQLQ